MCISEHFTAPERTICMFRVLLSALQYMRLFFVCKKNEFKGKYSWKSIHNLGIKKKKSWVCCCRLRVAAGRGKTDPSKRENVLDGEAVAVRTKQPMFPAPAPNPWTVSFTDLLSFMKEVHSLWCCSKIMWKWNICRINLAQLEVMPSYEGAMDRTQDSSISLTDRGPHVVLGHGIFCWKRNLRCFANPQCVNEGHKAKRSIYSTRSNFKQSLYRKFGELA